MWFGHQSNPRTAWGWSLKIYFLKIFRSVRESQGTHGEKKNVGKTNSPTVWVSRNVLFLVCIFFYITAVLFEWIRAVAIMVVGRSKEIWGWGCTFYSFSYHFFCKMATGLAKSSKVIFYAWKSFWHILVFPFPNEKWKEKFAIFLNF